MNSRSFYRLAMIVSLALFHMGCSLFGAGPQPDNSAQERDVPFQARKSTTAELRKRVLVLPFLDSSAQRGNQVAEVARKTFIRYLGQSDQVVIVDVADFPKDLAQFKKDDDWDLEAIGKIAGTMGITGVLEGKIMEVNAKRLGDQVGVFRKVEAQHEAKVRIRLVSARNGKEILNETRSAQVEASTTLVGARAGHENLAEDPTLVRESVTKAFKGIVMPILTALRKISWEGKIAMVSSDKIYVNAGRISGLQMGDILKVREPSESVYDPESGELVGIAPGRVKGTLEIISYFGKDGAVAVVHSGSGFQESDPVELY